MYTSVILIICSASLGRFAMTQEYVLSLARLIFGIQEYREAFQPKSERDPTWFWRFWGRIGIAFIAIVFFVYQQLGYDTHISSDFVAYTVLLLGIVQAAAPLFYLVILRFPFWFFVTESYKRDLERRKWPDPWKSILVVTSEAVLIVLSVLGFVSHPPYLVLLVFFWSIPVTLFYIILPLFVLWGSGHTVFLSLARFDDQLERPEGRQRQH